VIHARRTAPHQQPGIASGSGARIGGCTIAAGRDLPSAVALATSFRRQHPTAAFTVLVVDHYCLTDPRQVGVEFVGVGEIGLSRTDAQRLPKIYAPDELRLALKPLFLQWMRKNAPGSVIYLDAHTWVLSRLVEAVELARISSCAVLVRRGCDPGALPNTSERFAYEPGFFALGAGGDDFLETWSEELRRSLNDGTTINRTVIDAIAERYSPAVLEHPGYNVGYWNLAGKSMSFVGNEFRADGEPLRFFNFAGYDIDRPHLLSRDAGHAPRVLLSGSPPLAAICNSYREAVLGAQRQLSERFPHGFGRLPSGLRIDRSMHAIYRRALARFNAAAGPTPPDPSTSAGEAGFIKWLNQRMTDGKPEITRYMLEVHAARIDLQDAFPEPLVRDAARFHAWFMSCGRTEENVPPQLLPGDARAQGSPSETADAVIPAAPQVGVNVVGYFRAELGLGEAARLLLTALDAAGIPYSTAGYSETDNRQAHDFVEQHAADDADINIVCINPDQFPRFAAAAPQELWRDRYTIAIWVWEADEFPEGYEAAFDYVDEVWVATDFVHRVISKVSPKPVFKYHLPIVKPAIDPSITRTALGIPDRFCFLFSFDFLSVLERKNPVGLIEAFCRAFAPGEGPVLVLKTINAEQRILESEKLKYAIADHPDVVLLDGYLSALEKNTLTALCHCYVSLHRSEGYGLTMAEAMALAKPVIATGYSGNLEFMTPANSYLCRFTSREIGAGCDPYPPDAHWSEPDVDHAAALMREVYTDQAAAVERGRRASADIEELHSPAVAGIVITQRLEAIRRHRSRKLHGTGGR
jgi:glycosyltransferase involved in cell wall biosynthesis